MESAIAGAGNLWRLSEAGERSLGLSCTAEGLFFGGTALVERCGRSYRVRLRRDLERLFLRAYGSADVLDRVLPRLAIVASSLTEQNLCLAQIAAVHLMLPDLPDMLTRGSVEAEDRLIKAEQTGDLLNRAGWDPAEHPRAGIPPNPGWFAPTGGGPVQTAQGEEDERALEEMTDPLAEVRQARWNAAIARLREIDPANLNLTHFANRDTAPSEAAIDRLNSVVEAAAIKRVTDKVMPNGVLIGTPGRAPDVQILPGGIDAATDLFEYLRAGGDVVNKPKLEGTLVKLPGQSGFLTFRAISSSGPPAIDVNVRSMPFTRFHFLQGK